MTSKRFLFVLLGFLSQAHRSSSYFDGLLGDSDVFQNPSCQGGILARNACECRDYNAECVSPSCQICKCRKTTRIYRSDVKKCLSDIEARDPCKYNHFTHLMVEITTFIALVEMSNFSCAEPNAKMSKDLRFSSFASGSGHE
jgi:hypothetical protein